MKKYLFLFIVLFILGCNQKESKISIDLAPIIPKGYEYLHHAPTIHIHILKDKQFYVCGEIGNIELLKNIIKLYKADLDSVQLCALVTYEKKAIITKEISDLLWNEEVFLKDCKIKL